MSSNMSNHPTIGQTMDTLTFELELALAQKRASWQRDQAKLRTIRIASFAFLFLILMGASIGGFVLWERMNQAREDRRPTEISR